MKQRILSAALALCLFISSQSVAYAYQENSSLQEDALTEETADRPDSSDNMDTARQETFSQQEEVLTEESTEGSTEESTDTSAEEPDSGGITAAPQESISPQENILPAEATFGLVSRDSTTLSPAQVYADMTALMSQDAYKEGTPWTNDVPYSDTAGYYHWNGGPLGGTNIVAVGCVAFAFILSDAAFGSLPARMYAAGSFSFEDIKVGDILQVNNDTHTVIVLEVSEAGVVVAEGNISTGDHEGRVHWGRAISKAEVMNNTSHYITRYPEDYIQPDDPGANVSIGSGTLDGELTWNLTQAGTLTISGQGAMPDFGSTADQPWSNNASQIRKIVIESGVTSIGSSAFWNCGVLSAEIPDSVTMIGSNAFRASSIVSVTIPSSVKTIGDSAFRECPNLSSATISEGVETIGSNAFRACASLTSVVLPASIGEVGDAAFFQCQAMTDATFVPGSKQVELGDNLFMQCYYLMNVTLPKSINRIGEGMFQNCMMLGGVEVPQGAESIGALAFASCSSMTTVIIPDSVTTIGSAAFSACPSLADIYFTGTEAQWNSISKIGDTASAVLAAAIHYNYTPATDPDDGEDNDNNTSGNPDSTPDDNPGSNSGGSKPGNNAGNTSSGNRPDSSSSNNDSNNMSSGSAETESIPMASSVINSGIKAVVETWKPTTPDELRRYACMGKETVRYTLSKDNDYPVVVENAMQGPMCFKSFEAVLGDYTIGRTYNIYALSNTTYSTNREIQLTIEIPSSIYKNGREYKMICVTKGGKPIIYNDLDSNPETITIRANKFYAYALIYK